MNTVWSNIKATFLLLTILGYLFFLGAFIYRLLGGVMLAATVIAFVCYISMKLDQQMED